jgi:hypothetical protein
MTYPTRADWLAMGRKVRRAAIMRRQRMLRLEGRRRALRVLRARTMGVRITASFGFFAKQLAKVTADMNRFSKAIQAIQLAGKMKVYR